MPPKEKPAKTLEQISKENSDRVESEGISTTVTFIIYCSGENTEKGSVDHGYRGGHYVQASSVKSAGYPCFDYVDVYLDGVLISEGEPSLKCQTEYGRIDYTSSDHQTQAYKCHSHYSFSVPRNMFLRGKISKSLLGKTKIILNPKSFTVKAIYYYKGHEECTLEKIFELPSSIQYDDPKIKYELELGRNELSILKNAVKIYGV